MSNIFKCKHIASRKYPRYSIREDEKENKSKISWSMELSSKESKELPHDTKMEWEKKGQKML